MLSSNDFLESLLPVILSVGFLIFSFVYFFAAFAHNRFCSAMYTENVYDADDDSAGWAKYENLLNFKTFAQSLHTLFQMAIIGSWSMVMDAAAKEFPFSSFLFFYSYRLFMTLTVMPILFSFIIQIFIIRRDLEEQNKRAAAPPEQPGDRDSQAMDEDEASREPSTASASILIPDLSHNSAVDDVSSFINSVAAHHPDILPSIALGSAQEISDSDRIQRVRRSSMNTHIAPATAVKELDMIGLMWSSDPTSLKHRPVEVVEAELREVKEHLASALRLLHRQLHEFETESPATKGPNATTS
jgi:hypothetical protein